MKNKFKLTLLSLTACFVFTISEAQERSLTVSTKTNTNRSVDFTATKIDPGTYTLILNFNSLNNVSAGVREVFTLSGYGNNFYTMNPTNKEQGIGYSFSYTSIRGKLKPKYDPEFVYILPYKNGTKVRATESAFANAQYFGSTTPEDWKSYRFYTKTEDTITAVRKGTVVEVKDLYETESKEGVSFTTKVNSLTVEHVDGTLALYRGFKKGSFAIKVGDVVFPGTKLGVNSKSSSTSPYNVSLMLFYLKSDDVESSRDKNVQTDKSLYGFITAKFHTAENPNLFLIPQQEYTVAASPEIIQKEFTKKELKALTKK